MNNNMRNAFIIGYNIGKYEKKHYSYREILDRFPQFSDEEIDVCLNGIDDGIDHDNFRLKLLKT